MLTSPLSTKTVGQKASEKIRLRTLALFEEQRKAIFLRTDKLFAGLFFVQWFGAVFWSLWTSPLSWQGSSSGLHIHVTQSILLGGLIICLPLYFIFSRPGSALTRHLVAAAQMLFSGLLIAASGGRIETHFHVFGSLAFLAFYRDWRPLVTASLVTAADHIIRGIYAPATIYGVSYPEPWRWFEHTCWVLFCDAFLAVSINQSIKDMLLGAGRQAELEMSNDLIEQEVKDRTEELRQSEQDLRESEATIRAIFETAADSIITVSENGAIERANRTCEEMFGYPFHQIFGKHISYLLKACGDESLSQDSWQQLKEQAFNSKGAIRFEGIGMRSKHSQFPVEIALSFIDIKGRKLLTAIIRDISERKEAELRVSEFYSIVSHELRTPLTSIRGSLGLIEGGLAGELSFETSELVGIARESCDRLIRLINDILDLKKLESGKFEFHKLELKCSDLIDAAIASIQGIADEREVLLSKAWTTEESILVDPDRIQQVLVNLISNAIKYSPRRAVVEISAIRSLKSVRFRVSDQGCGIAENKQHLLFAKFQQIDSSDRRQQEGTGLGLAICKAIVEQHGGTLGVDSEEGKGASFWFDLPCPAKSSFLQDAENKTKQILLIDKNLASESDPDPDDYALPEHIELIRVQNSKEAAEIISEQVPDLVVFCHAELGADDFELQEQLRVLRAKHGIPLVLQKSGTLSELESLLSEAADLHHSEMSGSINKSEPESDKPLVLVIEDDGNTRRTIVHILESNGIDCLEAADGLEGLDFVSGHRPQLIVLDVGLPGIDGFQFVEELKSLAGSTPILVYTGKDLLPEERKRLTIGFTRYMTKSRASQEELISAVRELLKQQVQTEAPGNFES